MKLSLGEKQYLNLLSYIRNNGDYKEDRTGTGTLSVFGPQLEFNLAQGFPLLTTKKVFMKGIIHELLWFISGNTNIAYLKEHGVTIWDAWCDENGNLGPVYGHQWRNFGGVDQLAELIHSIKTNPDSRRLIVSAWNPVDIPHMALPPCHTLFQFYVCNGKLSCKLYQRSADMFLGVPFNIASYALLTHMVAKVCDLEVGRFIWTAGDAHIYTNHLDQVDEQLSKEPYRLPTLEILGDNKDIEDFIYDDFVLHNYVSHASIKAPVAV